MQLQAQILSDMANPVESIVIRGRYFWKGKDRVSHVPVSTILLLLIYNILVPSEGRCLSNTRSRPP